MCQLYAFCMMLLTAAIMRHDLAVLLQGRGNLHTVSALLFLIAVFPASKVYARLANCMMLPWCCRAITLSTQCQRCCCV
jgi:hypothetical protein